MASPKAQCGGCRSGALDFAFTMAFQPVVDVVAERIEAYEALVRGPNGEGAGHVLAQLNTGNLYAFDQACRVRAIELATGLGLDRRLNINFLPNAVYEPAACIQATLRAAARTGLDPRRLTFEIVESELVADPAHLQRIVQDYRARGFRVALDDFGSGYSGLVRLAELRPDIVKVDRALVQDCDTEPVRLAILDAVLRLGRELGIAVVLEGIEREGELLALRRIGARYMQGFYFARPAIERLAGDAEAFRATIRPPAPAMAGPG